MDLLIFKAPILIVQASMDGILLGILFALIAYGMALQWGVMNIINIAQGELVIMGGYIAYFLYTGVDLKIDWIIDFTLSISWTGIPSVIQTISSIPASLASIIALPA